MKSRGMKISHVKQTFNQIVQYALYIHMTGEWFKKTRLAFELNRRNDFFFGKTMFSTTKIRGRKTENLQYLQKFETIQN